MRRTSEISRSFTDLRALADSFSPVPSRMGQRRHILVLSSRLGPVAVPLLCRQLLRGDAAQASWAYFLLLHGGGDRALRALRAASADAALPDARRGVALALLGG